MACPSVLTGNEFLVRALSHLDCQAQTLGSFGFQSLAAPGSPAAVVLTALLTLFVALYGIRLLFGPGEEARDLVAAVLKVGIVLTIAVSWPAWRVVAYDTVLYGPAEVAASIMPSTLPNPRSDFPERLQGIDTGIAAFTVTGTGRQTGDVTDLNLANSFRSIALADETGLGWSRTIFLATTIGSLAALRIAGGLLLALAPLFAALLLFDLTRGLFAGWLRGLALVALGSLGLTILLAAQVAILEPWLADVLNRRTLGYGTPTAPTELLALVIAFSIAIVGLTFFLAKVAFQNAWIVHRPALVKMTADAASRESALLAAGRATEIPVHSRAVAISESVATTMRRDEAQAAGGDHSHRLVIDRGIGPTPRGGETPALPPAPLGSGYRRNMQRGGRSQQRRDERG